MPSTAFGPLVEPGWPASLPGPPDLGGKFLNAFYIGSEINRRKQALENQLANMSLKMQQNEFMNSLREADYERKVHEGEQRAGIAEQSLYLRGMMDDARAATLYERINKQQETAQDIAEGSNELIQSGTIDPADPEYVATRLSILHRYPGLQKAGWNTDKIINEHNAALRSVRTNMEAERTKFVKKVASDVLKDGSVDAAAILSSPEKSMPGFKTVATQAEKDQGIEPPVLPNIGPDGKLVREAVDERGQTRKFEFKNGEYVPAGQKVFRLPSIATPGGPVNPRYTRITDDDYARYSAQLKSYDDKVLKLPPEMMAGTNPLPAERVLTPKDYYKMLPGQRWYFIRKDGSRKEGVRGNEPTPTEYQ